MSSALSTRNHHASQDLPADLPADSGRAATGIAIVLMAQLMLVLDVAVMNVALPRIDTDMGFGPASLTDSRSARDRYEKQGRQPTRPAVDRSRRADRQRAVRSPDA